MATLPQEVIRTRRGRPLAGLLAGLCLCLSAGCVTLGGLRGNADPTKIEPPCQMTVRWENEVAMAPDTTRDGRPTPGLVGRVWLFGKEIRKPVTADGSLHVELADPSVTPPRVLEQWNIDPDSLKKLQRPDALGDGYSLFLPCATYRPDLKQVHLRAAFRATNGEVLFSTPTVVTLNPPVMPATPMPPQSPLLPMQGAPAPGPLPPPARSPLPPLPGGPPTGPVLPHPQPHP